MKSNINKIWQGEDLTNYQTQESYLVSIAQILGATLAIIVIKFDVNINVLIGLQILAQFIMGIFDYKVIKIIVRRETNEYINRQSTNKTKRINIYY